MRGTAIGLIWLGLAGLLMTVGTAGAELRCDQFNVVAERSGDQLSVSLDTDCPEFATIRVSVDRTFYRDDDIHTAYILAYFEERSTVEEWKEPREIPVAHSRWYQGLEDDQATMSRLGMSYSVHRVEDDIRVRIVLPVNQEDPRFGPSNENLVGDAVQTSGPRIAVSEVAVDYPLPEETRPGIPSTDPYALDHHQNYRLSRETPLMRELDPADPMAAIQQIRRIPENYIIQVLEVSTLRGDPWYYVSVRGMRGEHVGTGWINSIALVGQRLVPVE